MDDDRASKPAPKLWDVRDYIGRGAFQSAQKDDREVVWSVWKRKCRHK